MRIRGRQLFGKPSNDYCLLSIKVPSSYDSDQSSAEQLLASWHDLLQPQKRSRLTGALSQHISLEITSIAGQVSFYIWLPKSLASTVTKNIRGYYPHALIKEEAIDYAHRLSQAPVVLSGELALLQNEILPITGQAEQQTKIVESIIAGLSKIDPKDEAIWIQILIRPIWQGSGSKALSRVRRGQAAFAPKGLNAKLNYGVHLFGALSKSGRAGSPADLELPKLEQQKRSAIEDKISRPGYRTKIRLFYCGQDQRTARLRLQALAGAFRNFSSPSVNGFRLQNLSFNPEKQLEYYARFFIDKGFLLNSRELATIFDLSYLPAGVATAEEPAQSVSLFGLTSVDSSKVVFGIRRQDRPQNLLILGEASTGKSHLLELLMLSDIFYGQGFALIDAHGDLAEKIISFIPKRRFDDVVYFNLGDLRQPIGFNPLENDDAALRGQLDADLVSAIKTLFNDEWGPLSEYLLRQSFLALMDYPEATLLDINRLLKDETYRREIVSHIKDEDVKSFWQADFEDWQARYPEIVITSLNKIGDFTTNPTIKNVVGQSTSTFDIRKLMNQGKILIVNLDRRLLGEANASAMGMLLLAKLRLAAASRLNDPAEQARPFYLYIDDFHNFVADPFLAVASESRRLGLNLTLADQSLTTLNGSLGTKLVEHFGSMISFKLKEEDAKSVRAYFKSGFSLSDLTGQRHGSFVASLIINQEKAPAFAGQLLNLPMPPTDNRPDVVAVSRANYGVDSRTIDKLLTKKHSSSTDNIKALSGIFRLATKGLAKTNIGKVATGSANSARAASTRKPKDDDERIIKLH